MMIMQYGCARQPRDWHVNELRPPQYVRIYYMDSGSVQYSDPNNVFSLASKYLYIFPTQQRYAMTQDPENPISCLYLHADISPYILYKPIKIDPSGNPDILFTLDLMRNQLSRPNGDDSCFVDFGMALLKLLIRDGYFQQKIDHTLLDIQNLSSSDTINDLSRKAGYSREHFIRLFTASVGVTPYQYILNQRMNEALALMNRGMKLEEIAQKVGYSCAKSFSNAFKRRYGMPPQKYRAVFLQRA